MDGLVPELGRTWISLTGFGIWRSTVDRNGAVGGNETVKKVFMKVEWQSSGEKERIMEDLLGDRLYKI